MNSAVSLDTVRIRSRVHIIFPPVFHEAVNVLSQSYILSLSFFNVYMDKMFGAYCSQSFHLIFSVRVLGLSCNFSFKQGVVLKFGIHIYLVQALR